MDKTPYRESYLKQLLGLKPIIEELNARVIGEIPDKLIYENVNLFTKSFFVMMCAYLESYLKDALMVIVDEMNIRLSLNKLPHNLIKWNFNLSKELKENEIKFEQLTLVIKKKELDEYISGSPYRTKDLFNRFGIDLNKDEIFTKQKDGVNSIITKRNKILHHNDEASDVTNMDLLENIQTLSEYIDNIDKIICKHLE